MTLTSIPPSKFIYQGVYKVYWLPVVASSTAPLRSEINAGIDLTPSLYKVGGFALQSQITEVAPVGSQFVEQRPGAMKAGACTLQLYDDKVSPVVRTTWLVEGQNGCVLILPYGDSAGLRCDVWRASIASVGQVWEQVGYVLVTFAIKTMPSRGVAMPA